MKPVDAINKLPFCFRKELGQNLPSYKKCHNVGQNSGVNETDLVFKEIQIGEGPRLKRGKAVSRGMWHPF